MAGTGTTAYRRTFHIESGQLYTKLYFSYFSPLNKIQNLDRNVYFKKFYKLIKVFCYSKFNLLEYPYSICSTKF